MKVWALLPLLASSGCLFLDGLNRPPTVSLDAGITSAIKGATLNLRYAITEEAQNALLPLGTYGPVLASVAAKATPEQAKLYVSFPTNLKEACIFNDEEVAKYTSKYEDDWKKFQLG